TNGIVLNVSSLDVIYSHRGFLLEGSLVMAKRAHGEGSITHRKDGRWMTTMTLEDGKRKYFYGATQAEALGKLREALHQQKQGTLATGKAQTLKTYLNHWLEDVHKSS